MMPDKKRQIKSVIGTLLLILFFVFMNLIQDNWSLPRIILLAVSLIVLTISTISTIIKIQKK